MTRWKRFNSTLIQTYAQIRTSDVSTLAGSLAFTTAVSLVPLLAVSLSVFTAFGGLESLLDKIEPFILHNLVDASGAEFSRSLRHMLERVQFETLGVTASLSLMFASTKLFHDMERAVHKVWGFASDRKIWRQFLIYWLLMFFGPLALAILLGVLGSKDIGLIGPAPRAIILVVFQFFAMLGIYKFVPSTHVSWKSSVVSAAVATFGLFVVQTSYSSIMKTVLSTNKIYGSLASVPLFLIWILILWWACLTGVALCVVLEKRRQGRESVERTIASRRAIMTPAKRKK